MTKYFDETTENILAGLEETQKQFWNISRVTAEFLYTLIRAEKAKNVVEVGTSNGYSGIWLGNAVKSIGGHLTTIEFWDKKMCIRDRVLGAYFLSFRWYNSQNFNCF